MCCACCFIQKWMARPHILAGTSCLSLHRPNMVIRVRVLVMCQCKLRFADIVAVVVAQHRQPAKTKQQSIGGNLFAAYNASFSVSIRGRTSCGAQKECIPLTHWRNSPISYIYIYASKCTWLCMRMYNCYSPALAHFFRNGAQIEEWCMYVQLKLFTLISLHTMPDHNIFDVCVCVSDIEIAAYCCWPTSGLDWVRQFEPLGNFMLNSTCIDLEWLAKINIYFPFNREGRRLIDDAHSTPKTEAVLN